MYKLYIYKIFLKNKENILYKTKLIFFLIILKQLKMNITFKNKYFKTNF